MYIELILCYNEKLNFNKLLTPKTLSITVGDPARILLPLSTALTVGKSVDQNRVYELAKSAEENSNWDSHLPFLLFAYWASIQESVRE